MQQDNRVILIVDDNRPYREAVARNLRFLDYDVLEAEDAGQAQVIVGAEHPQVVITDLSMRTRTEGLQLIEQLKARYPLLPVILISAVGTFEEGAAARQLGAVAVLAKTRIEEEMETLYATLDDVFAGLQEIGRFRRQARQYLEDEHASYDPEVEQRLLQLTQWSGIDDHMRGALQQLAEQLQQTRQQRADAEAAQAPGPVDEAACRQRLQEELPGWESFDAESQTMLVTAERLLPEAVDNLATARNVSFSISFAVENELKRRLAGHLHRFLSSKQPRRGLLEQLLDRQLKSLDLHFSRYLLRLLETMKPTPITHELVRRTLELMRRHQERYKPDGLKALGVMVLLFGRTYGWEADGQTVAVRNPLRLQGLEEAEVQELAQGLVELQHLRNPFVHPEFQHRADLGQLRSTALRVLVLAAAIQ